MPPFPSYHLQNDLLCINGNAEILLTTLPIHCPVTAVPHCVADLVGTSSVLSINTALILIQYWWWMCDCSVAVTTTANSVLGIWHCCLTTDRTLTSPTGVYIQSGPKFINKATSDYLWSPYVIGQTIYIFILFLLLLFFSSPNLSSRRLDVYHTSAHGVVLV